LVLIVGALAVFSPATPALFTEPHWMLGLPVPRWVAWGVAALVYGGSAFCRNSPIRMALRFAAWRTVLFPDPANVSWPWIAARVTPLLLLVVLFDLYEKPVRRPQDPPRRGPSKALRELPGLFRAGERLEVGERRRQKRAWAR
jgi:hypothetical protein